MIHTEILKLRKTKRYTVEWDICYIEKSKKELIICKQVSKNWFWIWEKIKSVSQFYLDDNWFASELVFNNWDWNIKINWLIFNN